MESAEEKVELTDEIVHQYSYSEELIPSHINNKKVRYKKANEVASEKVVVDEVKTQLPSTNRFKYHYDDTYIPDTGNNVNAYSVSMTQYIYDIARFYENGDRKDLWDVITDVYVDAESGYSISYYEIDMRANLANHQVLGATWLQSNTSNSISLGSGIEVNSEGQVTGSVNTTTSYTYNASSQEIINDFPAGNIKGWNVDPVNNKQWGATWNFVPGIRFVNNNPNNYYNPQHGAYTKLMDMRGYRSGLLDSYLTLGTEYRLEMGLTWYRY